MEEKPKKNMKRKTDTHVNGFEYVVNSEWNH